MANTRASYNKDLKWNVDDLYETEEAFFAQFKEFEKRIEDYEKYRDMTLRAYGTITNCYSLQESEMMELLAKVKLGQVLGFIDINSDDKFQKLFYEGCSANLGEIFELFNQKKENIVRAEYISNKVRELAQRRL